MKVVKTVKTPTSVSLHVTGEARELESIKNHVLGHFVSKVKVPGFRAGKAPLNMVEKNVDQRALMDEFMEHALNELYNRAVREENLRPIMQPKVELKKFVPYTLIEFTADVEIIGDVKLANYKQMKLAKKDVKVVAKDVNDVIEGLQKRLAERKEVIRAAKVDDEVVIDFVGKDKSGRPIKGGDGQDYPLALGSKTFIPGFEENVVGLKPSEEKEFTVTFPNDYGVAVLQGQEVNFKVTVKAVREIIMPKVDDAFAAKVGPFKTVEELKKDIKKQVQAEREQQAKVDYENELIKKITDKSEVELPDSLIDDQVMKLEEDEKRNLVYRGTTWQEHLDQEGVTEEQHRTQKRPEAEERLKASLVLTEIAEQENLSVTPEELEVRIQILKSQYKDAAMQAELDKQENRQDIAARILTEKTLDKLTGYASK